MLDFFLKGAFAHFLQVFSPIKKKKKTIEKNNPVNPIHAKIYPTESIQTKTYMLVANHQVTHLHLATIFTAKNSLDPDYIKCGSKIKSLY